MQKLLTDEQVQQFIVDGCISLQPDVDPSVHQSIDTQVREAVEKEFHPGNNIVSRVPLIWDVLRSPVIHGALTSLLGPNYYVHPHRAIHTSTPVEDKEASFEADKNGPPMGRGSRAGSGWHQDAQSPLSRSRHHTPKYLIGFYFPHETPEVMGPTRYQAGSYLFSEPVKPSGVVLPDKVDAGTFLLLHFDTVHAGWPNRTDRTRYMLKFVFQRTDQPSIPTWDTRSSEWNVPSSIRTEKDLSSGWKYIWSWMRGSEFEPTNGEDLSADLNNIDQEKRIAAIYQDNSTNLDVLLDQVDGLAGQEMHERRLAKTSEGKSVPRDHVIGIERRWNERAIVWDDATYALGALGKTAIAPILDRLAKAEDPWVCMNYLFALGEIGPSAVQAVPTIVEYVKHPLQQVVRTALDALAGIGENLDCSLDAIESLFDASNDDWHDPQVMRGWHGEDQIRMNAVLTLLSAINREHDRTQIERIFEKALGDQNGYVSAIAVEGLTRLGTETSTASALRFLYDRRWDETLRPHKPF